MAKAPTDSTKKQETTNTTATEQNVAAVTYTPAKAKKEEKAKVDPVLDEKLIKKEGDPMPALAITDLPGYEITEVTFDRVKAAMLDKLNSQFRYRIRGSRTESEALFSSFFDLISTQLLGTKEDPTKFFKAHNKVTDNVIYFDGSSVLISNEASPFYDFGYSEDEDDFNDRPMMKNRDKNDRGGCSFVLFSKIAFEKLSGTNLLCGISCVRDSQFTDSVVIPERYYLRAYGNKEFTLYAARMILKDSILNEAKNLPPINSYGSITVRKSIVKSSTLPGDFDMRSADIKDCTFPHSYGTFEFCKLDSLQFMTHKYRQDRGAGVSIIGTRDKRLSFSNARIGEDERTLTLPSDRKPGFRGTLFGLSHPMHLATFKNAFLKAERVTMVHTVDDGMVICIDSDLDVRGGAYISQNDSMELIRAKIAAILNDKEVPTSEHQTLLVPLQSVGCGPLANPFDRRFDEPVQRTIDTLTEIVASRLNIYRMLSQLNCN